MAWMGTIFLAILAVIRGASAQNLPLSNTALRCCILEEAPYTMPDPARPEFGNWSGLAIDVCLYPFECDLQREHGADLLSFSSAYRGEWGLITHRNLSILDHWSIMLLYQLPQYLRRLQYRTGLRCTSITNYTTFYALNESFGGFSGFVNRFESCAKDGTSFDCECDMGVSAFSMSSKRLTKVDFVAPFSGENYRVLTSRALIKSGSSNKFFFFKVFSWSVWLAIFALLVTHVGVTAMDSKFAPPRGAKTAASASRRERLERSVLKDSVLFRVRHSFFNTVVHLVGQTEVMDTHKRGSKETIMNFLALMIGIFLLTIFRASATVQVLRDEHVSEFRSVNDFKTCRVPPNEVCLLASGASRAYWDQIIAPASCISGDPSRIPTIVNSFKDGFSAVVAGKCNYFFTLGGQINWQVNGRYCDTLATVGKPFFYTSVGFVLPKSSNLTNPLTVATLQLRQEGQLMNSTGYTSVFTCNPKSNPSLAWDKLQIFFYFALGAMSIMLLGVLSRRQSFTVTVPAASRQTMPADA